MRIILVCCLLAFTSVAAADAPDPFADAEARFYRSFDPTGSGAVQLAPDALHEMWRLSPTRALASLKARAAGPDVGITLIAMSGRDMRDPRFADFLIAEYDRASPTVQADIVRALAPFDGVDDHVEDFLRRVVQHKTGGAEMDQTATALDRIERRHLAGLDKAETLIAEVAKADLMTIDDQQFLQGLWVKLDGEVPEEGKLRTMVGGTRVAVSFARDDEARAAYAPGPDAWVHLEGPIRSIHPAADNSGKLVEIDMGYAALSASTAPRVRTTPATKSGCGCSADGGDAPATVFLAGVLLALCARARSSRHVTCSSSAHVDQTDPQGSVGS